MSIIRLFSYIIIVLSVIISYVQAVNIEVPPLDEGQGNIGGSYYENTILGPDGDIIKEDRDFILTVLRVINEYMRWLVPPLVFGLLIYFGYEIIKDGSGDTARTKLKAVGKIVIGIMIIMLVYTAIRFVVNLY